MIKQVVENGNKFIFRVLSEMDDNFNRCYICDKKTTIKEFALLRLPTEEKTICLCRHCAKRFTRQAKVHRRIFLNKDKQTLNKIRNNEIGLPDLFNSQLLQLSYAHKFWLDKQRSLYAERRNKGKN